MRHAATIQVRHPSLSNFVFNPIQDAAHQVPPAARVRDGLLPFYPRAVADDRGKDEGY